VIVSDRSASISGIAAARSGRWKTTRWKKLPPFASSEYWSSWTMLPLLRVISAVTAATMPGRSGPWTIRQA
jgi:hypothetical protein